MKKRCLAWALIFPLLAACPADAPAADTGGQDQTAVYFLSDTEQGRQLATEMRVVDDPCSTAGIQALINSMYHPQQIGHKSLIPSQVQLQSVVLSSAVATIDFSGEYQALLPLEQSLVAGGVAMTLLGVDGIDYVRITSEGSFQPPMGERYYSLDRVIINSGSIAMNAFDVNLYFMTGDGTGISAVRRTIKTDEEYPSPRTLLTELLTLPEEGDLLSPLQDESTVNSCKMDENGVCHVDLSRLESGMAGRLQVAALVNTLAGYSGVEAVMITVGGEPPSAAGVTGCDGELSFSGQYVR